MVRIIQICKIMKKYIKLLLIIVVLNSTVKAQNVTRWIEIGEATYEYGYVFPYKVKLFVPFGARNIEDMKDGLTPLKFEINWLLLKLPQNKVSQLFNDQLEQSYTNKESFKLSKNMINLFLGKMPSVTKHDIWQFIYYPDLGTRLMIDDKKAYHLVGSEINRALVDSWINKNPILSNSLFHRLLELQ